MTTSSPFITVENVTLRCGDALLFPNTDWKLHTDQHWAIIGPTGSGKSILANALCRNVATVQGRISFFFGDHPRSYLKRGEVVSISPDTLRDFLSRYAGYHQARWQSLEGRDAPTVSELLSGESIEHRSPYEVTPLHTDEAVYHTRRAAAIQLLGIDYLLPRKIVHVSHGESRKVLLARALMQVPQLLILDDPFCGLDSASRKTLQDAIEHILASRQFQIVLITSREEEILQGITHLLCVEEKQVVAQGSKDLILQTDVVRRIFAPAESLSFDSHSNAFVPPVQPVVPEDTLVNMNNVSVTYGDVTVLHHLNWTMRPGEHWAILGDNGAGKTTLLSMILADNPQAYANDILLFGKKRGSGESIWEIKRKIGWVSPELQIYYHRNITCQQVVCSGFFDSIGMYRSCSSEQQALTLEWMQTLTIEHLAHRALRSLSAGEQRLALLARALVKNPTLLVLDEPCQGLDAEHRSHIIKFLDQLCRKTAVSMIYVTHHADEMPEAISHILKLEHGRIHAIGTRGAILE